MDQFKDPHDKLMNLLVTSILKKHGVTSRRKLLSYTEKKEIRDTVQDLQNRVQQLLNNMHKTVTENDINSISNTFEDSIQRDFRPLDELSSLKPCKKKKRKKFKPNF